tara:strand:+ start:45 stop:1415 length:1371 start_codon:yes stop_codon:yes gene_type:complete
MGKALINVESLTQNIGGRSYSDLPPQYNARRKALLDLEKEFLNIRAKKLAGTATQTELRRYGILPREIKAVTITDPEVIFKRNRQGKWVYSKEAQWKVKGDALAPGLKPLESHHKSGLDKYYGKIKGWDDDSLYDLHRKLGDQGKYLGNHPKNLVNLDSSLHVGRARQFTPAYESIHGVIDYSDLTEAEWEELVDRVGSENIDYLKTDVDFDSDIGSPGDPKGIRRKRSLVPSDEVFEYATEANMDSIARMMDNDYQIAEEFVKKIPKTKIAFKGKSSTVNNFIKNNLKDKAFWPEDTEEAIKNLDLPRLKQIQSEIPLIKESSMQDALKSGKTLQQWRDFSRGITNKAGRVLDKLSPVIKTTKAVVKVAPYVGTALAIEGARSGISKAAENPTAENIGYAAGKSAAAVLELDPTGITPTVVDTATETFLTPEGRENWKKSRDSYMGEGEDDFTTM